MTAAIRQMAFLFCSVVATLLLATASDARDVRVGVFVTSLSGIDPRDGSFQVEGYAWFIDPAGTFEPERDLQIIARSSSSTLYRRTALADGATYTIVRFGALVNHAFEIRAYPFDSQSLRLSVEAADVETGITFVPDEADSRITGFGLRDAAPAFSRLTLAIDLERNRSLPLFEKFTGFFVGLIITAAVFAVPPSELGVRVGMMTSSIFAAVFNRYRLEDAIGFDAVFGLDDQVSFLTFSAILSGLGVSLLSNQLRNSQGRQGVERIDRRLGAAIMLIHGVLIMLAFAAAIT